MNSVNEYSTKDLYLASTLLSLGFTLERLEKSGNVFFFIFKDILHVPDQDMALKKDAIKEAVEDYWEGRLLIDPKKLFNAFREVKARMYNQ